MPVFEYRGIQISSGKPVKGYRDADNAKALRAALRKDGVLLTAASEENEQKEQKGKRNIDLLAYFRRPGTRDVAVMTRQLATPVRAGVPPGESIAAVTQQIEKEQLVRVMTTVRESLNEGTSFAKSLEQHAKVFPPLYVNMIAAGEASGTLRPRGRPWVQVETASSSFGQGISVTNLQLALATAAIANGGELMQPILV